MASKLLFSAALLLCLFEICYGEGLFADLKNDLVVTASPKNGTVLKAGEHKFMVTWGVAPNVAGSVAATYKTMKLKLCYAPVSQKDRGWRKTKPQLSKDKTCQFKIVSKPFDVASKNNTLSFEYLVKRNIPTATYFVRVYAFDAEEKEVAYGQTTDAKKTTNLFEIQAITGRHASLDIAAGVFSAFSIVALSGFFYVEKRKGKSSK
ncbi:hypothetical protein ACHQM5_010995 [Ranunculus cassubicifolius]